MCVLDEKQHECLGPVIPVSGQRGLSKGVAGQMCQRKGFSMDLLVEEPFPSQEEFVLDTETFLNECDTVSVE